ncbi:MAG TPA: hypothetical protein ENL34_01905 [Chloroflexi bacterium]|nr:hypothetical protein [Chloroflexota bacterium]
MPKFLTFHDLADLATDYCAELAHTRRLPQNLFYFLEGAQSFYAYRNSDVNQIAWEDEVRFLTQQHLLQPEGILAFCSLGCGNAAPEKMVLRTIYAAGYQLIYVGVDSSAQMLELAEANLEGEVFPHRLVLADFMRPDFPARLWALLDPASVRLYAMMGGTFGNLDQHQARTMLARLVRPGEYAYVDVVPQYADEQQNARLRQRLLQLPQNLPAFFERLLSSLGLSPDQGVFRSHELLEREPEALKYTFFFEVKREVTVSCLGHRFVLQAGDRLELLTVRAYVIPSLIAFMAERGFELMGTHVPRVGRLSHLWQRILFVRTTAKPE